MTVIVLVGIFAGWLAVGTLVALLIGRIIHAGNPSDEEPLPAARVTFTHDELLLSFPRRLRVIRGVLDAAGDEASEADFDWRKDAA